MLSRYLLFSILWLVSLLGMAQSEVQWGKCYGGLRNEIPFCITPSSDGGYFVVGSAESGGLADTFDVKTNFGLSDFWATKISSSGMLQWEQHYGGPEVDVANQAIQLPGGALLMSGYSFSLIGDIGNHSPVVINSSGEVIPNADFWILQVNSEGAIQWEKALGGSYMDVSNSMIVTSDQKIMLAGYSASNNGSVSNNHGGNDFWVVKMDMLGNEIWNKTYGGSGDDRGTKIIECAEGGYLMVGYSSSSDLDVLENYGLYDFWIIRLNSNGGIQWKKTYGGSRDDRALTAVQTPDGGFAIAGLAWSNDAYINQYYGEEDGWVIKLDSFGNLQWERNFGGSKNDKINQITLATDGFYIGGTSFSSDGNIPGNNGSSDSWLAQIDFFGNLKWSHTYGGASAEQLNSFVRTVNGEFLLASGTNSKNISGNHGNSDFWVLKLNSSVGLESGKDVSSKSWLYPNISSGKVFINLAEIKGGSKQGQLIISDMMGRKVAEHTFITSDSFSDQIDLTMLENGVYLATFESMETMITQKIIIQK